MENVFTDFILPIHQFANTKHVMSAAFISNRGKTGLSSLTWNASASTEEYEPSVHTTYFLANVLNVVLKDMSNTQVDIRR